MSAVGRGVPKADEVPVRGAPGAHAAGFPEPEAPAIDIPLEEGTGSSAAAAQLWEGAR